MTTTTHYLTNDEIMAAIDATPEEWVARVARPIATGALGRELGRIARGDLLEEAIAAAIVRLWEVRGRVRAHMHPHSYLTTVALNCGRNVLRAHRRATRHVESVREHAALEHARCGRRVAGGAS